MPSQDIEAFHAKGQRILSISGGGIKGIAELCVLAEIEKITSTPISKLFNVITGTSVGGIIAFLLTIPKEEGSSEPKFSAEQALELFKDKASDIFPHQWYHELPGEGKLFSHKYSQKPLKKMLKEYLGESVLNETTCRLIIPVFDVNGKNDPNKSFDSADQQFAHLVKKYEVALATSAAPTYYKPVVNKKGESAFGHEADVPYAYVDGGLSANRPAAIALQALKSGLSREEQKDMLDNTMLCSLNFAKEARGIEVPSHKFDGAIGWITKGNVINKILGATEKMSTAEVKGDLPEKDQFFELSIPLPKECSKLDNVTPANIAKLQKVAKQFTADNQELLINLCGQLKASVLWENSLEEQTITDDDSGYGTDSEQKDEDVSDVEIAAPSTKTEQTITKDDSGYGTDSEQKDGDVSDVEIAVPSTITDKQQLLIKNLSDAQHQTLQKGLSALTPRESQFLEIFLQVLNNDQIEAVSGRLSLLMNGEYIEGQIPELNDRQNALFNYFGSVFMPSDDYPSSCGQEAMQQEIQCDGRNSSLIHMPDNVPVC